MPAREPSADRQASPLAETNNTADLPGLEKVEYSQDRFPDGAAFRVEIPSVEGPRAVQAVIDEASRRGVVIHRISQGSGVAMLADSEIRDMADACAAAAIELCLFLGPRGTWDAGSADAVRLAGTGPRVRGADQVTHSLDDAHRASGLGVNSLLVADEGVLWALHQERLAGSLPPDLRLKMSALAGPSNPWAFEVIERLGADSINVPGDLSLSQLSSMRQRSTTAMDLYVESPDSLGGFVRHHQLPALIGVCAPVYLKFGLRNAPDIYPAGGHIEGLILASARERVRRADLGMELLGRRGLAMAMSPSGSSSMPPRARLSFS